MLIWGTVALGESDQHAEELREMMFPHPDQIVHASAVGSSSPHEQDTQTAAVQAANAPAVPPFPVILKGDAAMVLDQARDLAAEIHAL